MAAENGSVIFFHGWKLLRDMRPFAEPPRGSGGVRLASLALYGLPSMADIGVPAPKPRCS